MDITKRTWTAHELEIEARKHHNVIVWEIVGDDLDADAPLTLVYDDETDVIEIYTPDLRYAGRMS
jgi:hypothetical protein